MTALVLLVVVAVVVRHIGFLPVMDEDVDAFFDLLDAELSLHFVRGEHRR